MTGKLIIALDRLGRLRTARWSELGQFEGAHGHLPQDYEASAGTPGGHPKYHIHQASGAHAQAKP